MINDCSFKGCDSPVHCKLLCVKHYKQSRSLFARKRQPEYHAWRSLISRCTKPNHPSYRHYGGRGIYVCDRWLESFENFLADMGRRPTPQSSIDRIDNDGPYSPTNCRWATSIEQNNNFRRNHNLIIDGETRSVRQWGLRSVISASTFNSRIRLGWDPKRAFITPSLRAGENK